MKSLVLPVLVIAGGYLLICAFYYLQQDRMLFLGASAASLPEHPRIRPVEHVVQGVTLRGFQLEGDDPRNGVVIVYFGGNAEDVAHTAWQMLELGENAYLFNYRGYGRSEGAPAELALRGDALANFDWIRVRHPTSPVVVFGRSLGSAMALQLAAERGIAGLILASPYTSIRDVAAYHFPWLPVGPLMKNPFDCVANARSVTVPTLVIAAKHDEVIPRRFTDALRGELGAESELYVIEGTDHNTLMAQPRPWGLIASYLASVTRESS